MAAPRVTGPSLGLCPGDCPDELMLPGMPDRRYTVLDDVQPDEWESRVGIPALEAELHLQRQLSEQIAPLAAIFDGGQAPLADGLRKQHRAWVAEQLIREGKAPESVAEGKLERLANADPRHIRYVHALRQLREMFALLRGDEKRLAARLQDRNHRCVSYAAESRMTR